MVLPCQVVWLVSGNNLQSAKFGFVAGMNLKMCLGGYGGGVG